jgi:sugar/nucleoside kinase (ribokinase family)
MSGLADPVKQAEKFRELGARTVVITCGGEGAVLISDAERWKVGTYPTECVDATGGGDAFDAGYICGLLEGASARRCLELGSALGASCVRRSGATSGVFTRPEAESFIEAHELGIGAL